ncbi:Rv2231c family pyridoxal phosphate-dependent protein CobC [Mycolicibacterium sphagni]|uniref:Rv2231c family pyridoxal phosphate-dependent protein CobC n=1 Tax=Mycolicibacterium sphagni TaxID=1786 RepID=UPI0021F395A8|nr:Rv2231c family pyridoxal phosphate-dependent protein CobC [Mycolicibacterium sphagni]MCV7178081.1 threonine-phosphate decarboxylase [Mycolicibacterium sphagni]
MTDVIHAKPDRPQQRARYHADQSVKPGMLDFAVNVRQGGPPDWLLERLAARLRELGQYPTADDHGAAVSTVAARHAVPPDNVLLLAGGAEAFALLPALNPRLAALIAPSFTEPEAVLTTAGIAIQHVVLPRPFDLQAARVPDDADLVVIGNPTNPTGVLHSREAVLGLRRSGRVLVVDEAFADAVPGEPESLAGLGLPDVLVVRSLTKTWSLAGLRVGYALGDPAVLACLSARRPHWPLGTLQLEAITACCAPGAVAAASAEAERLAQIRLEMSAALTSLGLDVVDGRAPFLLVGVPDAELVRMYLHDNGIAVRRCDTFVGLGDNYLRVAVRDDWQLLHAALAHALRDVVV